MIKLLHPSVKMELVNNRKRRNPGSEMEGGVQFGMPEKVGEIYGQ
jgi:hypothetical protein